MVIADHPVMPELLAFQDSPGYLVSQGRWGEAEHRSRQGSSSEFLTVRGGRGGRWVVCRGRWLS